MHPQLFIQIKREGQPGGAGRIGGEKNIKKQQSKTVLDAEQVIFGAKSQIFQNTGAISVFHITAPHVKYGLTNLIFK